MFLKEVKNQFPQSASEIEILEGLGFNKRSLNWLETLDLNIAQTACWLMGKVGNNFDADILVDILSSQLSELWMPAATALSLIATEKHLPSLLSILASSPQSPQRESALYTLSFLTKCRVNLEIIDAFLHVAANKAEVPSARGQALEGLGNKLSQEFPQNVYQRAVSIIIECLDDSESEVRFWACFAAGAIHTSGALPKLRVLAQTDDAVVAGLWSVGKEAQDSITLINGS